MHTCDSTSLQDTTKSALENKALDILSSKNLSYTTTAFADIISDHNPEGANIGLRLVVPKRKSLRKTLNLELQNHVKLSSLYEDHLNKEVESV